MVRIIALKVSRVNSPSVTVIYDRRIERRESVALMVAGFLYCVWWNHPKTHLFVIRTAIAMVATLTELVTVAECCC